MTLPETIYCQSCHLKGKQQFAAWAQLDPTNPRKADFYCFACLATEDIDIDECETIEAYRKMVADGAPPTIPSVPERKPILPSGDRCGCGNPANHRGRCWFRRGMSGPPELPRGEKQPKQDQTLCDCGRPKGHTGRHRGTGLSFIRKTKQSSANGGSRSAATARQPQPSSVQTTSQKGSNGQIDVGGFKARLITLDDYKLSGCREAMSDLDPIVAYVRTMKAGTVALWDTPKGKTLKAFRERLGRSLQKVHKLPVRVEMRKTDNVVAVIREGRA